MQTECERFGSVSSPPRRNPAYLRLERGIAKRTKQFVERRGSKALSVPDPEPRVRRAKHVQTGTGSGDMVAESVVMVVANAPDPAQAVVEQLSFKSSGDGAATPSRSA